MKERFNVTGMTCAACSSHIEKALSKTEGVRAVNVNLLANNMVVDYDEAVLTESDISRVVENAGYGATPAAAAAKSRAPRQEPPANLTLQEAEHKRK